MKRFLRWRGQSGDGSVSKKRVEIAFVVRPILAKNAEKGKGLQPGADIYSVTCDRERTVPELGVRRRGRPRVCVRFGCGRKLEEVNGGNGSRRGGGEQLRACGGGLSLGLDIGSWRSWRGSAGPNKRRAERRGSRRAESPTRKTTSSAPAALKLMAYEGRRQQRGELAR